MDPRKRLQVLQANNPSLRVATQPKPQLQVSKPVQISTTNQEAPAQTLSINTGQRTVNFAPGSTNVAGAKPKPVVHKSLADTLVPGYKAPAEAIARLLPGGMNDINAEQQRGAQALRDTMFIRDQIKRGKITPEAGQNIINANAQSAADASRNLTNTENAMPTTRQVAAGFGNIASDIVTAGIGAELSPGVNLLTRQGIKEAGIVAAKSGASALPQGILEPFAEKKKPTVKDVLTSTVANVATGAALPFAFKGVSEATGAVKNALGIGKTTRALNTLGIDKSTIKFLQAEKDPQVIRSVLEDKLGSVQGLEGLVKDIANTENAKFIRKAIMDLPIEAGTASTLAGAASEAAARGKYGVDPITGENVPLPKTAPEVAPSPSEGGIPLGQPNQLELQSSKLPDGDLSAIEQAGGEVPKTLPANTKTFNELPKNAGDGFVMADSAAPKIKQITKELDQVNQSLADIREGKVPATRDSIAALQLRHDQLVEEAQKPFDFNAVDGTTPAPKTQPEAPKTGEAPTEEQVAAATAKTQSGVADSAPSEPAAQTEAPTPPDQKVTEDINTNADNATKTLDSKTIRYTDAETGKTKVAGVAELRNDIQAFKDKYGTENLTAKQQRKLDELERNYHIATFDAEKQMVGATPEEKSAIQKIVDGLSENLKKYDTAKKLRAKERAIRFAKGTGSSEQAGGGLDGYKAKLGAMKGKMEMPKFNAVSVDPEARNSILDLIETNGKARGWQDGKRLNTQTAILKVLGEAEGAPTPSDIRNIREFFGNDVADTIQQVVEKHPNDWKSIASGIAGLPKSLMSTFDFSAPRQAGQLAAGHPVSFMKRYAQSFKAAFNEDYYNSQIERMAKDPDSSLITDDMGIDIPGMNTQHEERYGAANLAEKIPGYGKTVVKGSERAYNYLLGTLRYDVAKRVINKAGGGEGFKAVMAANYGENAQKATRIWGETINTLSGRGGAKGGMLEKHMSTASATLFSPRLWASKVQQLNPVWYGKLVKNNPQAAKEALKAQAVFYTMVGTTLYLASKAPGVTVGTDMRSADFGKIKIGNTRFDIMGGQQQNLVQAWRQITGEKVNSETGDVTKLGEGYGTTNRFDLFVDMLISKSNPLINTAIGIAKAHKEDGDGPLTLTNQYGDKMNVAGEIGSLAVPLNLSGGVETAKDTGSIAKGIAYNAPGVFGVGVNTYGSTPTKDQGKKQPDGTVEFKGKVTNDMVLDPNGKPILDKKGVPVKVKIPEGATKPEIQALKDQKRESAMKDAFKRSLAEEDQALLGRSDSELKKYVKDGVINQAKYDKLKGYREKMTNMGKVDDYNPNNIPDGIDAKSATGKFFAKYNSLSKEDRDKFTKNNNTTAESKALVDELNNNPENPKSIPKLSKGNNQLALLYAKYQADLKKPGNTDIDKQNKAKAFWNAALNTQYDSVSQDLVKEGSSADFKALYADGKITKDQLAQAIQLDNALYQTGWNKLKFSKKWREDNGIAIPSKTLDGKDIAGSGSGSGKSKATPNAYLSNLLPGSSSSSNGAKLPQFSEKSRQIKFAPNVNVGKSSNSAKKININL